jgi:hypothetical protein
VGSSGGRRSKTKTVIRTAKTASENALNRSGVAARSTAVFFTVCYRRFGRREFTVPTITSGLLDYRVGRIRLNTPSTGAVEGSYVQAHLAAEALNDCQGRCTAVQRSCCAAVRFHLRTDSPKGRAPLGIRISACRRLPRDWPEVCSIAAAKASCSASPESSKCRADG